ncbi:MAG TPA: winged helix-turn-helix domain-containing protein [Pyrinomonadaceae bacterium]|nr:winged helix-turn-helix domain-containing protein [Pyrinomonadaceae bacterium]
MSEQNKTPKAYKFDDVVVDCRDFRVVKTGAPRRLTPRAFEVLVFLLTNCGRVVGKQELFDSVWKESFVTDNALTRMVKEIRRVIGDDADAPSYIETVPKRGYRFMAKVEKIESDEATQAEKDFPAKTEPGVSSIAVLPFANQSGDADNDYLSEGITEGIINNLSHLANLRVIPRSTVFYFQGRDLGAVEAGRRLNVQMALSGRVLQRGDTLMVNAELVDVSNEAQIWGEQYRYKLTDIFDLQQEISRTISAHLRAKFGGEPENRPAAGRATPDAEAYRLYLKGRYFWNRRPQGLFKGIEYFEQALEKDASFALAYAGLADSYSTLGSWENGALPPAVAMPKACAAAQKGLAIDGTLAEAHTTLAYTKLHYDWDFAAAEAGFRRALELNGNYVHAHHWLSHYYIATGQIEKSLQASLRALELDPLDLIINSHLSWHYWMARQPDEALRQAEKTRELDARFIWSDFFAGLALEEKGFYKQAAAEFKNALDVSPEFALAQASLAHALGCHGEPAEAGKIVESLEKHRSKKYVPAYDIAIAYLGIGNRDAALSWLAEAVNERSGWAAYFAVEPRLDALRRSPQFDALIERVRLEKNI